MFDIIYCFNIMVVTDAVLIVVIISLIFFNCMSSGWQWQSGTVLLAWASLAAVDRQVILSASKNQEYLSRR